MDEMFGITVRKYKHSARFWRDVKVGDPAQDNRWFRELHDL
jgi:hypothetical protein